MTFVLGQHDPSSIACSPAPEVDGGCWFGGRGSAAKHLGLIQRDPGTFKLEASSAEGSSGSEQADLKLHELNHRVCGER